MNLGITRARQGRIEEAVSCFQRAVAADPASPKAYVQLGLAFAHQHRDEAAVTQFQQALAIAPKRGPEVRMRVGVNRVETNGFSERSNCLLRSPEPQQDDSEVRAGERVTPVSN